MCPQSVWSTLSAELLDDERTWQGDYDPYLGTIAREGSKYPEAPVARARRLKGPPDDGDPYLAQLIRAGYRRADRS